MSKSILKCITSSFVHLQIMRAQLQKKEIKGVARSQIELTYFPSWSVMLFICLDCFVVFCSFICCRIPPSREYNRT